MLALPHGVPKTTTNSNNKGGRLHHHHHHSLFNNGSGSSIATNCNPHHWLVLLLVAALSFFLGTLTSLYAGLDCSSTSQEMLLNNNNNNNHMNDVLFEQKLQARIREIQTQLQAKQEEQVEALVEEQLQHCHENSNNNNNNNNNSCHSSQLFPVEQTGKFVTAMARVEKADFVTLIDPGVPMDDPNSIGGSNVILLYGRKNAVPTKYIDSGLDGSSVLSADEALENCDYVRVVLHDHSGTRKQCLAIVPQYESFHIFNYMREGMDASKPLVLKSRGYTSKGRDFFAPPTIEDKKKHWDFLQTFLNNMEAIKAELEPILKEIAIQKTIIVMVCNFGQSELLMNFVCSAKARNLDIRNILVFTTDQETADLAESIGLRAYYDHRNFDDIPAEAAQRYGDRKFVAMMLAKVICVQLVSMLGYDFLFQDVDIIWYKNPLEYFHSNAMQNFDVFFQDDGGHSVRYAPYSANSGFYYVKNNHRTQHFLTTLLMTGDVIIATHSHQQALIAVLNEHASLYGLKVKVLSRDLEEFPGGYQWNQKSGKYMKELFAGQIHPIIFHMSWTMNKDNKLLYFRQMGEWYVQDQCIQRKREDILTDGSTELAPKCCSIEPIISCHYRDKPSKIPCKDSPPIDKGRPSFWR